jgi:hypothetical protein
MIKNKKYNHLSLINYEGDVLRAYYAPFANKYLIQDDKGHIVDSLTRSELIEFFDGDREITTSYGKSYNFMKEHENARPKQDKIDEFLIKL